jgi:DNA-binding SARP family transcriptional activator
VLDEDLQSMAPDAAGGTQAPVGEQAGGPLRLADLPADGVRLTGPGALDAARGLLAAILVSGGVGQPQLAARAITTASVLATLGVAHAELERLTVAADAPQAVQQFEAEVAGRPPAGPGDDPLDDVPVLLLLSSAETGQAPNLGSLARHGHARGGYVAVVDDASESPTWIIDSSGHLTTGPAAGRVNVLDAQSLNGIVATLAPRPSETEPSASAPAPARRPTQATPAVRLEVLGGPTITSRSGQPLAVRRTGSLEIAVLLALHPQGCTREELLETVYGHFKRPNATSSLNTALWSLKRDLTVDGRSPLVSAGGRYRLDRAAVEVDWWELLEYAERGEHRAAVSLYRGVVAADYDWEWLSGSRQTVRANVATSYVRHAESQIDPSEALQAAYSGLRVDAFDERLHRLAMKAHAAMGHPDLVRTQLAQVTELLATLDAEPDPETRRLAAELCRTLV